MDCQEIFYLINLELDGEISAQQQKQLDDHRANCPHCVALSEELKQMQLAVQQMEDMSPSEGFCGRVLDKIREEQTPVAKVVPFRTRLVRYGSLAACAALCIGLYQSGIFHLSSDSASMSMSSSSSSTSTMSVATTSASSDATTALPESAVGFTMEERAVAEIAETEDEMATEVTTTTVTTEDIRGGLTLPEQVAELLEVEETAWIMISPNEVPDPLPEGVEGIIVTATYSFFTVEPDHWDEVRQQLNFGISDEVVEEGVPCVVIIMPE